MIVRVATEVVLDKLYQYAVPPELEPLIKPGLRIKVPLGSRVVDGYIVELLSGGAADHSELPLFSGKPAEHKPGRSYKLRLINSISDDFYCSWINSGIVVIAVCTYS